MKIHYLTMGGQKGKGDFKLPVVPDMAAFMRVCFIK